MKPFTQSLFALALGAALFGAGVFVGRSLGDGSGISVPERIEIRHVGIPNEKVECLEWVGANYDKPQAGLVSLLCNGK
jgi:hypothetical protein